MEITILMVQDYFRKVKVAKVKFVGVKLLKSLWFSAF